MKTSPISRKNAERLERKKKKIEAFLELTSMNKNEKQVTDQEINYTDSKINQASLDNYSLSDSKGLDQSTTSVSTEENEEIGKSGKRKLKGEEYLELKKRLRDYYTAMRHKTKFRLRDAGENASLDVDPDDRMPLFLSDIQHLLLYSQLGIHAPYSPARWCCLEKYNRLVNTNILVVENISLYDYVNNESNFQFLKNKFPSKLEILSPTGYNGDVVKELSLVPITGTQMKKILSQYGSLDAAVKETNDLFDVRRNLFPVYESDLPYSKDLPSTDKFSRTQILLSGWQLVEENFPLPIKGLMERKYSGYVLTKDKYEKVTSHSPMFGIDCEMCKTSTGENELTRVSVVDEKLNVLYDTLVKPHNKIIDYLTRYSGITPQMMKNVTKRLTDVQKDLRDLLPADAILVGQSLGNDLHALKMMHPYVIDTSIIFNLTGNRLRKTKLQTLAREFLFENIQTGKKGHCSTEDCTASLKLAQLKLSKSPDFGDAALGGKLNEYQSLPQLGTQNYATCMFKHITRIEDKTSSIIGNEIVSDKYKHCIDKGAKEKNDRIEIIMANDDKEIVDTLCNNMSKYSFNLAHIKFSSNGLRENESENIKELDNWIEKIYNNTSTPGLFIVIFGGEKDSGNGCCFISLKN